MFQNYEEAMEYVSLKRKSGIRFDLTRMEQLMVQLDHPERKVKTIHIAGTNGKGSTVTYLRSIIKEAGYLVGTFMTPLYDEVEQQIAINGEPISKQDFVEALSEMKEKVEVVEGALNETISEFELMTAFAFYYFAYKKPVDIAIIEAGMGGRHDATNFTIPLVSIITNVAMDHQAFLGDSLEAIAKEKAGIIKSGVALVTGADDDTLPVFEEEARVKKATLYAANKYYQYSAFLEDGTQYLTYDAPYLKLEKAPLGMIGEHQAKNAALAVTTVVYLKQFYALLVDEEHILAGLEKAFLPGRFEIVQREPLVVLDTAHNVAAMRETVKTLKVLFPEKEFHVLFAAMKDKDLAGMLKELCGLTNEITLTSFSNERAASLADYEGFAAILTDNTGLEGKQLEKMDTDRNSQKENAHKLSNEEYLKSGNKWYYNVDYSEYFQRWMNRRDEGSLLLVTGSNFFVDEFRDRLKGKLF